jgi:hypothetical protein
VTVSFSHPESSAISGRRLTHLLGRWAAARRLDPRQAETIRQTVLAAPVDLGFDWWWRLLDPDSGTVFRATAWRTPFAGASRLPVEPPSFATGAPALTVWPEEEAEYQPYLRLA